MPIKCDVDESLRVAAQLAPMVAAGGRSFVRAHQPLGDPATGDWPGNVCQTGFWFDDNPAWDPPADLTEVLSAGVRRSFLGFGSMPSADPSAALNLMRQAARQAGRRAVIRVAYEWIDPADPPQDIYAGPAPIRRSQLTVDRPSRLITALTGQPQAAQWLAGSTEGRSHLLQERGLEGPVQRLSTLSLTSSTRSLGVSARHDDHSL